MHITRIVFCTILKFYITNAAILVWSNKEVRISPLLPFDDEDLEALVKKLDVKKVFLFKVELKSRNAVIPRNLKEVLEGFHSSFNPNGNIGTAKAVELTISEDCNGIDTTKIKKVTGPLNNSTDFLCVLDVTYPRRKRRETENKQEGKVESLKTHESSKVPVIYIGETRENNQYAILYSSRPLKLEVENFTLYLGNIANSMITVDKRLNIPVPLDEDGNKVTMRFDILWKNRYWYIQTVKIQLIIGGKTDIPKYNLTTTENIMAPAHFSYHCSGKTVFSDKASGTNLTIFDLQVQLDAKKKRFGDANDCVPFTTAPIWSGLFVTTILGLGLIVALTALMDIKTMDKFDNQATKNLGITVMD
ncbi:uncharacterized protein LOC126742498 isoform X2 [Anthonomus grandis grandis]|uniref:uncharacterized protein LOC126742498 isoform X2 n=1 Tax=Anthonomus grandis grandis TaxID=2921223 RepID=UPI00216640F5|nr:uncharacterized protein LOC126742498 isoform X2 [Anthonomus grandis grandis]